MPLPRGGLASPLPSFPAGSIKGLREVQEQRAEGPGMVRMLFRPLSSIPSPRVPAAALLTPALPYSLSLLFFFCLQPILQTWSSCQA